MSLLIVAGSAVAATWPNRLPYWPHYPNRTAQVLDGTWQFNFLGHVDPLTLDCSIQGNCPTNSMITVPSCFDFAPPGVRGARGTVLYSTTFSAAPGERASLTFSACGFFCRVWVDGVLVAEHVGGGYTPFTVEVAPFRGAAGGDRTVVVVANNEFNRTISPLSTGGDFYAYGGLHRSVIVLPLPPTGAFVRRVEVVPLSPTDPTVSVRAAVAGVGAGTPTPISVFIDGAAVLRGVVPASAAPPPGRVEEVGVVAVADARRWSPDAPHLHTATVCVCNAAGAAVDCVEARFGLRTVAVEVGADGVPRVGIDGVPIQQLRGVNHHTLTPGGGATMTQADIANDVAILKQSGFTWVRGAHYPADQRFLDLADEVGLLVWEEALGPNVAKSDATSHHYKTALTLQIAEMTAQSANHPSVVVWAFLNEGCSHEAACCDIYATATDAVRAANTSRLVSWASNHGMNDVCIEQAMPDIASFNAYPGWYDHPADLPYALQYWQTFTTKARAKWPAMPIVASETGAGGIYEWANNGTDVVWGLNFQTALITAIIKGAVDTADLAGVTLWHMYDFKVDALGQCDYAPMPDENNWALPHNCSYIEVIPGTKAMAQRPGGENHKGVFDFWRRPKPSAAALIDLYRTPQRKP